MKGCRLLREMISVGQDFWRKNDPSGCGMSIWACWGFAAGLLGERGGARGNEDIKRAPNAWRRPVRPDSLSLAVGYGGDQCMPQLCARSPWRSGRHSGPGGKAHPALAIL